MVLVFKIRINVWNADISYILMSLTPRDRTGRICSRLAILESDLIVELSLTLLGIICSILEFYIPEISVNLWKSDSG